jgi:Niemann-Pick C1 protein
MENNNRNHESNDLCEKEKRSVDRYDDEIVELSTNADYGCYDDQDEHDNQGPPVLSSSTSSLSLSSSKSLSSSTTTTEELQGNESLLASSLSAGRLYECIDLDDVVSLGSDDEDLESGNKLSAKKKKGVKNKDSPTEDGTNITENSSASLSSQPSSSESSKSTPTSNWTKCILFLHRPIRKAIVETSVFSAKHPKSCVFGIVTLAFALVTIGFLTNYTVEKREDKLWTPQGSKPDLHYQWIEKTFPAGSDPREYFLATLLHADGDNVASIEGMQRQFQVLERIRSVQGYKDYCQQYGQPVCGYNDKGLEFACKWYNIPNDPQNKDCEVLGATSFWLQNYTLFETLEKSDRDVLRTFSIATLPGKYSEFDISNVVGYPEYDVNETMTSGKAFLTYYILPRNETNATEYAKAEALERLVTEELKLLQEEWDQNQTNPYRIEMFATRSFEDEFVRGVNEDMVLLPLVAFVMMAFTSLVFYKHRDPLHSRALLGIGATATVVVSIMTGYGIMFICGIPFTSLSQVSANG